jgi:hypothetical protein
VIIIEQNGIYSIRKAPKKGFEIYKDTAVASVRCAIIGFDGDHGLQRARAEVARRQQVDQGSK